MVMSDFSQLKLLIFAIKKVPQLHMNVRFLLLILHFSSISSWCQRESEGVHGRVKMLKDNSVHFGGKQFQLNKTC